MFEKQIIKCIDDCYKELLNSKNSKIKKQIMKLKEEIPEEMFEFVLKNLIQTIISDLMSGEIDTNESKNFIIDRMDSFIEHVQMSKVVYTFKVELVGHEKEIYRIMEVPQIFSLAQFCYTILSAFHAEASHLFDIVVKKKKYYCDIQKSVGMVFGEILLASDYTLDDFNFKKNEKLQFNYDYGDSYEFSITFLGKKKMTDKYNHDIVIEGEGYGIWEDAHYELDLFYSDKKKFNKFIKENEFDVEAYPIDAEFDIDECNQCIFEELMDLTTAYEDYDESQFMN